MNEFLGKIFYSVTASETDLDFYAITGEHFNLSHDQDCCESVWIESIDGSLSNLEGSPILRADEKSCDYEGSDESCTATFYTFATSKGYVDIRFNGESNGYYSESVNFHSDNHTPPTDILAHYSLTYPEAFL